MKSEQNVIYIDKYKQNINKLRIQYKRLTVVEEDGLLRNYMFIVLNNEEKKSMKVLGYSNFFFNKVKSNREETLEYHAKIIVAFLNYVFFDKYDEYKLKDISELKIEFGEHFLRDYSQGRIGNKKKTRDTIEKAERTLTRFYRFLYEEVDEMKYLSERNFVIKKVVDKKGYSNKKKRKEEVVEVIESLFRVQYPEYVPPNRIKHLPSYVFQEMLDVCDVYYPHLKLALCLQAFGGLRRGEVCNVSKDKINYSLFNKDMGWFQIDLSEKTQMRSDGVDVGGIKKKRVQPIHPVFLSLFQVVYNEHKLLIEGSKNPYGAIFLNRNGEAMTAASYEGFFKKIMNYTIQRLSNRGDFKSASEVKILMSGRKGTHVLRHFFTQFLGELETTGSPLDVAYWRGDDSLDSAITYFSQHPVIDNRIKAIQEKVFEGVGF